MSESRFDLVAIIERLGKGDTVKNFIESAMRFEEARAAVGASRIVKRKWRSIENALDDLIQARVEFYNARFEVARELNLNKEQILGLTPYSIYQDFRRMNVP